MSGFETPILFIIFNRIDTAQRVFDEIKKQRPRYLYVAADGPRADVDNEKEQCELARAIIKQVDWPCDLKTLYRDENLGCGKAVSSALAWFFKMEEFGIVLEDDCLPCDSFFKFQRELLIKYKNNEKVGMISGTNILKTDKNEFDSYYFSKYPHIWGWGSWSRVWKFYDFEMNNLEDIIKSPQFRNKKRSEKTFWIKTFNSVKNKETDTWDAQVSLLFFMKDFLTVIPKTNQIENIGFGASATHTKTQLAYYDGRVEELDFPLIHPEKVESNLNNDNIRQMIEYRNRGVLEKIKNKLSKMLEQTLKN